MCFSQVSEIWKNQRHFLWEILIKMKIFPIYKNTEYDYVKPIVHPLHSLSPCICDHGIKTDVRSKIVQTRNYLGKTLPTWGSPCYTPVILNMEHCSDQVFLQWSLHSRHMHFPALWLSFLVSIHASKYIEITFIDVKDYGETR